MKICKTTSPTNPDKQRERKYESDWQHPKLLPVFTVKLVGILSLLAGGPITIAKHKKYGVGGVNKSSYRS